MSAEHTNGELYREGGRLYSASGPWPVLIAEIGVPNKGDIEKMDEILANAERFELLWNACIGMTTESLKGGGAIQQLLTEVETVVCQRNDLLAALEMSVAAFHGDEISEIESEYGFATAQRVESARAAIAKARDNQV